MSKKKNFDVFSVLFVLLCELPCFLREMTMSRSKNSQLNDNNKARWWKASISFSFMKNRLLLVPMEVIVSSEDQCLVATVQKKWRIHHPLRGRPHSWLTRVWWRKMMSLARTFLKVWRLRSAVNIDIYGSLGMKQKGEIESSWHNLEISYKGPSCGKIHSCSLVKKKLIPFFTRASLAINHLAYKSYY